MTRPRCKPVIAEQGFPSKVEKELCAKRLANQRGLYNVPSPEVKEELSAQHHHTQKVHSKGGTCLDNFGYNKDLQVLVCPLRYENMPYACKGA
jgi:hypothetical protein